MNIVLRLITFTLASLALAGCGYLKKQGNVQDRDTHYLTARSQAPLKMPPGTSSESFHNTYPVSDAYPGVTKPVSIVPPGLNS